MILQNKKYSTLSIPGVGKVTVTYKKFKHVLYTGTAVFYNTILEHVLSS